MLDRSQLTGGPCAVRSNITGELTGSGFVEFLSVERAAQALTKVGGSVTPYGSINLEYALSREAGPNRQGGQRQGGGGAGMTADAHKAAMAADRAGTAVGGAEQEEDMATDRQTDEIQASERTTPPTPPKPRAGVVGAGVVAAAPGCRDAERAAMRLAGG
ncbi:hypothetical protein K438DRAFT_1991186 [Mycena galopus ATCC 62051]|nr:hypothetical protein K438DRAFT_1991186 [Mycena galopus ATCC 62051]